MRWKYLVLLLVCLIAPLSIQAKENLWSEKESAAPLLAQVPDFAALAKNVSPAVVAIRVEQKIAVQRGMRQPMSPFDFFFGPLEGQPNREFRNQGLGSGFAIRDDGLILTNHHVVENADVIEVTIADENGSERRLSAKVLGTAPEYDVALIQTEKNAHIPIVCLGNSDSVSIGDWVLAVGNPFGLAHSVSVGIISAKERRDIMPSGRQGVYNFLQTDASINPGNSGGPLVNMRGEVIGINSAINAAGAGIGFAIPINMVKEMLYDLKTKGKFSRSWLGILIQPMDAALAESFGLKEPTGALVAEVVKGGPANQAGIEPEDIVIEFDGKPVRNSSDLPLFAGMAGVGKKVKLKVLRQGSEKTFSVTLLEYQAGEFAMGEQTAPDKGELGLTVADMTPDLRKQFNLEMNHGVVVKDILPGSVAERAGLQPGDVILNIGRTELSQARDFFNYVRNLQRGALIRLRIYRSSEQAIIFIAMKKP